MAPPISSKDHLFTPGLSASRRLVSSRADKLMTERDVEEYKALRATIRQRGSARPWAFLTGLSAWAAVTAATTTLTTLPLISLLPLLLLAATFEVVFALHVGVERIGRYLQVFHQDRWEQTAMAFGPPLARTGSDPLFTLLFLLATVCNFVPVLLAEPLPVELGVLGAVHLIFGLRLLIARNAAAGQRAADLARFRSLLAESDHQ